LMKSGSLNLLEPLDLSRPVQELLYLLYRGANKSLARPDWKTIERSPFFVRCGGHCCCRDLVGRTAFWIFL